jgi:hypothetical protein
MQFGFGNGEGENVQAAFVHRVRSYHPVDDSACVPGTGRSGYRAGKFRGARPTGHFQKL